MKIKDIISLNRGEVVSNLIKQLQPLPAYVRGQQNAEESASKMYERAVRLHYHQNRWWKVALKPSGTVFLFTRNSKERILIRPDGNVLYEDDMHTQTANSVQHVTQRDDNATYFFGTRAEVVKKAPRGEAITKSIPPINMF